jgi:hypothetical protein
MQAGINVLEEAKPDYAQLIKDGTIPLVEASSPQGVAEGVSLGNRIVASANPNSPGSTAIALHEEIYHAFQPGGRALDIELEAKAATAQWAISNHIDRAAADTGDIEAYVSGGTEALKNWLMRNYPDLDRILEPGMLYKKE